MFVTNTRKAVEEGLESINTTVIGGSSRTVLTLKLTDLIKEDRDIILAGCLMNYYAQQNETQSEVKRKKVVTKYI